MSTPAERNTRSRSSPSESEPRHPAKELDVPSFERAAATLAQAPPGNGVHRPVDSISEAVRPRAESSAMQSKRASPAHRTRGSGYGSGEGSPQSTLLEVTGMEASLRRVFGREKG